MCQRNRKGILKMRTSLANIMITLYFPKCIAQVTSAWLSFKKFLIFEFFLSSLQSLFGTKECVDGMESCCMAFILLPSICNTYMCCSMYHYVRRFYEHIHGESFCFRHTCEMLLGQKRWYYTYYRFLQYHIIIDIPNITT